MLPSVSSLKRDCLHATMDEIAEAAELSKGTLYLYYSSKEDLYLAVMMRGMDDSPRQCTRIL